MVEDICPLPGAGQNRPFPLLPPFPTCRSCKSSSCGEACNQKASFVLHKPALDQNLAENLTNLVENLKKFAPSGTCGTRFLPLCIQSNKKITKETNFIILSWGMKAVLPGCLPGCFH